DRLCRRPAAKTSLDRVMCHDGERNPVRYAQPGEHVPQVGVHGMRDMYSRLATAPFVSPSATSSDTARSVAVRLSQPAGRTLGSRRPGRTPTPATAPGPWDQWAGRPGYSTLHS